MDEDKIDRTIEIILQQQAQFYADMQRMQESQERSDKHIGNLQEAASTLLDAVKLTGNNIDNLSIKVDGLTNTVDKLTNTADKLADAQRDTDERLNAVIYMAERFFSDKQNGNSK